jgi:hypothetical protein
VSKQATCTASGKAAMAARTPARLWGWCSGASGQSASSRSDQVGGQDLRRVDVGAAMDHAMADARDPSAVDPGGERLEDRGEPGGMVGGGHVARAAVEDQPRLGPQPVDLAAQVLARVGRGVVEAELDRGGPGVQRQDQRFAHAPFP